jgi:hypothetical protein
MLRHKISRKQAFFVGLGEMHFFAMTLELIS